MAVRVKQVVAEIATAGPAAARIKQVALEAMVVGGYNVRVRQVVLEVMRDPAADPVEVTAAIDLGAPAPAIDVAAGAGISAAIALGSPAASIDSTVTWLNASIALGAPAAGLGLTAEQIALATLALGAPGPGLSLSLLRGLPRWGPRPRSFFAACFPSRPTPATPTVPEGGEPPEETGPPWSSLGYIVEPGAFRGPMPITTETPWTPTDDLLVDMVTRTRWNANLATEGDFAGPNVNADSNIDDFLWTHSRAYAFALWLSTPRLHEIRFRISRLPPSTRCTWKIQYSTWSHTGWPFPDGGGSGNYGPIVEVGGVEHFLPLANVPDFTYGWPGLATVDGVTEPDGTIEFAFRFWLWQLDNAGFGSGVLFAPPPAEPNPEEPPPPAEWQPCEDTRPVTEFALCGPARPETDWSDGAPPDPIDDAPGGVVPPPDPTVVTARIALATSAGIDAAADLAAEALVALGAPGGDMTLIDEGGIDADVTLGAGAPGLALVSSDVTAEIALGAPGAHVDATLATEGGEPGGGGETGWTDGIYRPADVVDIPWQRTFLNEADEEEDLYPGFVGRGWATPPDAYLNTTQRTFGDIPALVTSVPEFVAALDDLDAEDGGVIMLADGTWLEAVDLTAYPRTTNGWILVRGQTETPMPAYHRITRTVGEGYLSGFETDVGTQSALKLGADNHHLWFTGLTFRQKVGAVLTYTIIETHQDSHDFVWDRCYSKAAGLTVECRRNLFMACYDSAVIDCWFEGAHQWDDAQAIMVPVNRGKTKIVNNYLEGTGENAMYGGAGMFDPTNLTYYPKNAEVRRNHFYTPQAVLDYWTTGCKNRFELKCLRQGLIAHNVFENHYDSGVVQRFAVAMKSTDQSGSGAYPHTVTKDITFYGNGLYNVAGGFSAIGQSDPLTALRLQRIDVDQMFVLLHDKATMPPSGTNGLNAGINLSCDSGCATRVTITGGTPYSGLQVYGEADGHQYSNHRLEGLVADSYATGGNTVHYDARGGSYPALVSGRPEEIFRAFMDVATSRFVEVGAYEEFWGSGAASWPQAGVNGYHASTQARVSTSHVAEPPDFVNPNRDIPGGTADYNLGDDTPWQTGTGEKLGVDYDALMVRLDGVRSDVPWGLV